MQLKQAACLMIPVMASSNFKPAIVQIGNVPSSSPKINPQFTGEHSSKCGTK
jgi:hypothetical protein